MVVAYNNGNKSETYRLQKKLMLSFEARALAVRKITSNVLIIFYDQAPLKSIEQ
jgi:hypothetical protein